MNRIHISAMFSCALLLASCGGRSSADSHVHSEEPPSPYWIKIANIEGGTVQKRFPVQSSELERGTEKCGIEANALIYLSAAPIKMKNGHYLINRMSIPPGCQFSSGFLFVDHVAAVSENLMEQTSDDSGYKVKAKLDTWIKLGTGKPETMELGAEKCTLHYGETVDVLGIPLLFDEQFYAVTLKNPIPGCKFQTGLIHKDAIDVISPRVAGAASEWGRTLARHSLQAAADLPGSGYCYRGVAHAFASAGLGGAWGQYGIPGGSAYQFGRWANANPQVLESVFRLRRTDISAWDAPVGSLFVFEPGHSGAHAVHGHIEIKVDDNTACSDYCGSIYRSPSYIYVPL